MIGWNEICEILSKLSAAGLERKYLNYRTYRDFVHALDLSLDVLGKSSLGKQIFCLKIGSGPKRVLAWSQMHGNEPSSTIALLYVLEYLSKKLPGAQTILRNVTFCAVPMLNPDGADKFTRRNAINIDLNRDAIRTIAVESKVLKSLAEQFLPHWAFNMHDQEIYYGTKDSTQPTALALLASSVNPQAKVSNVQAKKLVGYVVSQLPHSLTIARYNDVYMPTAFGDYFATKGINTLLFETGYFIDDHDRHQAAVLHAAAVLLALLGISTGAWNDELYLSHYNELPFNRKYEFFDVILRNVTLVQANTVFTTDLALSRDRRNNEHFTDYDTQLLIYDIGDLSYAKAFKFIDCRNVKEHFRDLNLYDDATWLVQRCEKN